MIKPDDFPFSQEIYDDIEAMRATVLADPNFETTPEFIAESNRLYTYVLSDEWNEWDKARRNREIEERLRKVNEDETFRILKRTPYSEMCRQWPDISRTPDWDLVFGWLSDNGWTIDEFNAAGLVKNGVQ